MCVAACSEHRDPSITFSLQPLRRGAGDEERAWEGVGVRVGVVLSPPRGAVSTCDRKLGRAGGGKRVELRGGEEVGGRFIVGGEDVVGEGRGSGEARVWRRCFDLMSVGLQE